MEYIQIISEGNTLRGMKHLPECRRENPCPVVLVHGYFSATRNGPQRLFIKLAKRLADLGFTVYRFDLSGMGESDGNIGEITFKNHVKDLSNIIEFVRNEHKDRKVNLIAHSLGCNLALELLQKDAGIYDKIVFLAPFITNNISLRRVFNRRKMHELFDTNSTYRKGLYVDKSYFIESSAEKFTAHLNSVSSDVNVFVAQEDQFIPSEISINILDRTKAKVICLPEADHNFLETQKELSELVCKIFDK